MILGSSSSPGRVVEPQAGPFSLDGCGWSLRSPQGEPLCDRHGHTYTDVTCTHRHEAVCRLVATHRPAHQLLCPDGLLSEDTHRLTVRACMHTRRAHFPTAALAGTLPHRLGINSPLRSFYTFTFLFLTHFKVLFRVRSEDGGVEGGGSLRVEKQAIWKIPVIFELFPKTPMGAT